MKKKSPVKKAVSSTKRATIKLPQTRKNETYKGIVVSEKGKPLYHVIERTIPATNKQWADAVAFAKNEGYVLPDRRDGALLRASDPRGQSGWFWLSEPYEGYAGCAWAQVFDTGYQDVCRKGIESRVRLVRRELIS